MKHRSRHVVAEVGEFAAALAPRILNVMPGEDGYPAEIEITLPASMTAVPFGSAVAEVVADNADAAARLLANRRRGRRGWSLPYDTSVHHQPTHIYPYVCPAVVHEYLLAAHTRQRHRPFSPEPFPRRR